MPAYLGFDTSFQIFKTTFGNIKIRALYVGDTHIWPEYNISTASGVFSHNGNSNKLGTTNWSLQNTNPSTLGGSVSGNVDTSTFPTGTFFPDLDPAGCTISFQLYVNETSSWHYLPFKLLVPPDVTSVSAKTGNGATITVDKAGTTSHTSFAGESYTADIYLINCENEVEINPDAPSGNYDVPITITISISQNKTTHPKYRDIVLQDVGDEFNVYGNLATNKIITGYRQRINFDVFPGSIDGATYDHNQCGTTKTIISSLSGWLSGTNYPDLINSSRWSVSLSNNAWSASTSGNSLTLTIPNETPEICTNGSSCTLTLTYYYKLNASDAERSISGPPNLERSITASATFSVKKTTSWTPSVDYISTV